MKRPWPWMRIVAEISLLAFLLSCAGTAFAAKPNTRETELRARKAFAAGQHQQALELFAELYAETLHPVYLRNIGRCHQKMGAPQEAIGSFRDYLAKAKSVDATERREIEGYIREMEQLLEQQRAQERRPDPPSAAPPPAVSLAPVMPAEGGTPPESVAVQTAPDGGETPVYKKWWFWTGIGAVVAGAVVTGVVLSGGDSKPPCPGICQ
jgi:hypothetical protein